MTARGESKKPAGRGRASSTPPAGRGRSTARGGTRGRGRGPETPAPGPAPTSPPPQLPQPEDDPAEGEEPADLKARPDGCKRRRSAKGPGSPVEPPQPASPSPAASPPAKQAKQEPKVQLPGEKKKAAKAKAVKPEPSPSPQGKGPFASPPKLPAGPAPTQLKGQSPPGPAKLGSPAAAPPAAAGSGGTPASQPAEEPAVLSGQERTAAVRKCLNLLHSRSKGKDPIAKAEALDALSVYGELTTGEKDRFLAQWLAETRAGGKSSFKWAGQFKRSHSQTTETRANVQQGLMTLGSILGLNGYSVSDFEGDLPRAVKTAQGFLTKCYRREGLDPNDPALSDVDPDPLVSRWWYVHQDPLQKAAVTTDGWQVDRARDVKAAEIQGLEAEGGAGPPAALPAPSAPQDKEARDRLGLQMDKCGTLLRQLGQVMQSARPVLAKLQVASKKDSSLVAKVDLLQKAFAEASGFESGGQLQLAEWQGLDDGLPIPPVLAEAEALAESTGTHAEAFRTALKKAKALLQ